MSSLSILLDRTKIDTWGTGGGPGSGAGGGGGRRWWGGGVNGGRNLLPSAVAALSDR